MPRGERDLARGDLAGPMVGTVGKKCISFSSPITKKECMKLPGKKMENKEEGEQVNQVNLSSVKK